MNTEQNLQAAYDAAYEIVLTLHNAGEYVCMFEQQRLGEAEAALTDYQIANGTFKGWE